MALVELQGARGMTSFTSIFPTLPQFPGVPGDCGHQPELLPRHASQNVGHQCAVHFLHVVEGHPAMARTADARQDHALQYVGDAIHFPSINFQAAASRK
jgi:hypothetical protein